MAAKDRSCEPCATPSSLVVPTVVRVLVLIVPLVVVVVVMAFKEMVIPLNLAA